MNKKAKETGPKSGRIRSPRTPRVSNEVTPPFVAHQNLNKENTATPNHPNSSPTQDKPKDPVRARLMFGRVFQNLAYFCLFLGIMAVLGVIVAAVMTYWTQDTSTLPDDNQAIDNIGIRNNNWVWIVLAGSLPGFMPFLQIIVGILAIIVVIWGWRTAIRSTRRLVVRITDEFLWSLAVVEPLMLSVAWLLTIIGVWWLAAPELFMSLTAISGGILVFGLICFWAMRGLAGSRLDLTRADLDLHK